jgi:hypothetical protein
MTHTMHYIDTLIVARRNHWVHSQPNFKHRGRKREREKEREKKKKKERHTHTHTQTQNNMYGHRLLIRWMRLD